MKKSDLIKGLIVGIIIALLSAFLIMNYFSEADLKTSFLDMRQRGMMGKVITLSCIPNLLIFFLLIRKNKDFMARGVLLSILVLAIVTIVL